MTADELQETNILPGPAILSSMANQHGLSCRSSITQVVEVATTMLPLLQVEKVAAMVLVVYVGPVIFHFKKRNFLFQKLKFRFDSVSLLATLNSMKSQYIERKGTISAVN